MSARIIFFIAVLKLTRNYVGDYCFDHHRFVASHQDSLTNFTLAVVVRTADAEKTAVKKELQEFLGLTYRHNNVICQILRNLYEVVDLPPAVIAVHTHCGRRFTRLWRAP